ncbi:hypothetical protein ETB97_007422 [Aspergillus alliaceus]|uniref:Uncharacterized protein n=1 Tax=Petromyces alliaceus TaxID=209559 RepID=A0A8H6E313_PETAA|nr:hypothetical protein ETB97_007422 [Aspergillus burnettii]
MRSQGRTPGREEKGPGANFRVLQPDGYGVLIIHRDCSKLYDDEYGGLLGEIVKLNDLPMLQQCLEKHPRAGFCPSDIRELDPFYVAAQDDAFEERGYALLAIACRYAQPETVHFLLDSQPSFPTIEVGHDDEMKVQDEMIAALVDDGRPA